MSVFRVGRLKILVLGILVLSLASTLTLAQSQQTGRIAGTITDEQGDPVEDARIELVSPVLQGERVIRTREDGQFLAALLPVGAYSVTISAPGKQTVTYSFRVGVGLTVPLDVVLQEGETVTEEITVYGETSKFETTALGENFDYTEKVEELPIQSRRLENVATYAPNISFGPTDGTIAIAGAPSFDTVTLLDGAEISDPYFGDAPNVYLEDSIEEVQVMTTGVSARYGRFQGGVVNAITKSGGNTFDGTVRAELDNQSWNSTSPYGEEQEDKINQAYQGTIGGYILKDRLWFFAGLRSETSDNAFTTDLTKDSVTDSLDDKRGQLKLRGAITPNHIVQVSYLERQRERQNRDYRSAEPAATLDEDRPQNTASAIYQGVLTPNLFLDVQATVKNITTKAGGDPTTGRSPFQDLTTSQNYNNGTFGLWRDPDIRDNRTFGANLTHVLSTGSAGTHTLEYGMQYVDSITEGWNSQSPTPYLFRFFRNLPPTTDPFAEEGPDDLVFNFDYAEALRFAEIPLDEKPNASIKNMALYVHDTWQWRKWRFDLGLRYERYDGDGPYVQQTADYDAFGPRLGVAYNIDRNWQVQASYGQYNARMNDNISNSENGVSSAPRTVDIYIGPTVAGASRDEMETIIRDDAYWLTLFTADPRLGNFVLDENVMSPYARDFNLTVKRALPRSSGTITLTYTDRTFKQLFEDFVGGYGIVLTPNGPEDVNVTSNSSSPNNRHYRAVTATWDYRPAAKWNVGGNLTYSDTTGNYEGEAPNQPAVKSIIHDYPNAVQAAGAYPIGNLSVDIPLRVNAWGGYRLDFNRAGNLALGGVVYYQSGFNWSKTGSVDMADLPEYIGDGGQGNSYTWFFDGRGNNQFDDFWSLDLSALYRIPIKKDFSAWVKLNVMNVLNNGTLASYRVTGTAVPENADAFHVWEPVGRPAPDEPDYDPTDPDAYWDRWRCYTDGPNSACDGFGRISSEDDYQSPRTWLITLGLQF